MNEELVNALRQALIEEIVDHETGRHEEYGRGPYRIDEIRINPFEALLGEEGFAELQRRLRSIDARPTSH